MEKTLKKALSVLLAVTLTFGCIAFTPTFAAGEDTGIPFTDTGLILTGVEEDEGSGKQDIEKDVRAEQSGEVDMQTIDMIQGATITSGAAMSVYSTDESPTKVTSVEITNKDDIAFVTGAGGADTNDATAPKVEIAYSFTASEDLGIYLYSDTVPVKLTISGSNAGNYCFYTKNDQIVGGVTTTMWTPVNETEIKRYDAIRSSDSGITPAVYAGKVFFGLKATQTAATGDNVTITITPNLDTTDIIDSTNVIILTGSEPLTELTLNGVFSMLVEPDYVQNNGPQFFHGQTDESLDSQSGGDYFRQRLQAVKKPYYSNEQVKWTIAGTSEAIAKYELYDARTGGNKIDWNTATTVTDVYIGIADGATINARDNADEVTITVTSAVNSALTDDCLVTVSASDFPTINGMFMVYENNQLRNLTADETAFLYVVDTQAKSEPQYREIKKQQGGLGEAMYELNLKNSLSEHIIQANIGNMLMLNKDETAILDGNTWIGVPYDEMRDPSSGESDGDFNFVELPKLKGKVVDKNNQGIPDVSVYGPSSATTGANGDFEMYLPLEIFNYMQGTSMLGIWKGGYYLDYSVQDNGLYTIAALPVNEADLITKLKRGDADIDVGEVVLAQEMIMPIPVPIPDPPSNPFTDYEKNSLRLYPGELSSGQYATAIAYMHNSGTTLTNYAMKIEPASAELEIKMPADGKLYLYELPSYTMTQVDFTRDTSGYYGDVINFTIPEFKANTQYMFSFGVSAPASGSGMRIGEIGLVSVAATDYGYGSSQVMLTITDLTLDCPPEVKKGDAFEVTGRVVSQEGTTLSLKVVDMLTQYEVHTAALTTAAGQSTYKFTIPAWAEMDSGVYEVAVSTSSGGIAGYVRVAPDPVAVTSARYYDNMMLAAAIPNPSPDLIFPIHVWMLDEYSLDPSKVPYYIEVGLQTVVDSETTGGEITDVTIGIQTRFGEFTYSAMRQSVSKSGNKETTAWKAELTDLAGVGISEVYAYVTQKSYTDATESFVNKIKVMNLSQIVDPSGYVYNASTNARIKDAEATLYYKVGANWVLWPAEKYQQINPQKTDEDGKYGWMVPEGDYEVRVTKSGYANYTTLNDAKYGVITVLPARTDINIGLTSTSSGGNNGSGGDNGSGGNNGGGSSSSSGGDTAPASTLTVPVEINGTVVNATLDLDGTLTLSYTEADIAKHKDDSGNLEIKIPEQEKIVLSIPVKSVGTDNLSIVTDFGTITIPNETLSELRKLFGDTLRLSIIKGSFKVALLDEKGNEIPYSNPKTPFVITLPYDLKSGQNPGAVVATKRGKIMPYAIYKSGGTEFKITETGIYDLIYNEKSFIDINGHWAKDNIRFLAAREMVSGMGDGEFSPNTSMTRAMFVQILANLESTDLSKYTQSRFSDVPIGQWYSATIEWAAAQGIVGGVGDGRFDPNANITREQMAVLMVKYMQYKGYALPSKTSAAFADEKRISEWAVEAVKAIQTTGIVNGKPGNLFDPQGTATRAEVATIFARFIELAAGGNVAKDANNTKNGGQLNALLHDRRKYTIVGNDEKKDA